MTISSRGRAFRACWVLSIFFAAIAVLAALRVGPELFVKAGRLASLQTAGEAAAGTRVVASLGFASILAAVLCSVYGIVILFLLSFRYSRTISMELFFFAFWALSLAVEPLRLESLRGAISGATFPERNLVTRLVLSARFLGVFSLFAGSLYAAGYNSEKHGTALFVVLLCSMALGTGLPVDTGTFGPDLLQQVGYAQLTAFLSAACFIGVCANYIFAARVSGERGYRAAALGCALAFLGGTTLRQSISLIYVVGGAVTLIAGTILFLRIIHRYYMWQ